MSGGHFNYDQYKINDIVHSIESIIDKNNTPVDKNDRWGDWDDRDVYYNYSDEVIEKFKEGVKILKQAQIYAQRIDWLVSCDDGEDSFLKRLDEDLKNIK
jgi:hypothetical protein